MLGAVIVHPEKKPVIPLCPEPIVKTDGKTKNDCERNASKRLLKDNKKKDSNNEWKNSIKHYEQK